MYERVLARELEDAAARMPIVTVTGPRQSGKTTLVREVFPNVDYVSLERPDERSRAREDPLGFLSRFKGPVILDEVQRAPELLSYIQVSADEKPSAGRFVLTGSQNLFLMEGVSQTLAGRTTILHLLPLTVSELFSRPPLDPFRIDEPLNDSDPPDAALWRLIWSGFYPRIHDARLEADRWLADYQRTYVSRDLRDVLRVMDLESFELFMMLVAARTGQELNLSAIASDVGISQPTARQWLTALQIGFLVTLLPPHHVSYRKRLRKTPRLHFLDTGLACYLLGIHSPDVLERHPLRGAIFESFVVSELVKAFENRGREAPVFHWKDAKGHEIDILLDLGEHHVPIEVKSGLTVASDAADTLQWWLDLPQNPNQRGVLVYGGEDSYRFRDVTLRPWFLS
jgi:predicted AAA+ superfamily ATPase